MQKKGIFKETDREIQNREIQKKEQRQKKLQEIDGEGQKKERQQDFQTA